jgi:tetratricopeptide (TPR) repeat protein
MNTKILKPKSISVCILLIAFILFAYWPVQHNEFINFDDHLYIKDNRWVKAGLTIEGFIWAFDVNGAGYWQPLTWLSHMLDVTLFGLNPVGHHLTNLGIHLTNALLLFWFFFHTTGRLYRSFFIAALFALHPLNVESVAWAASRKNLLSTFFWMLSLLFYVRYGESPTRNRYLMILVVFVMGLMVKPMLVTLPFVFLLLDYWPLRRLRLDYEQQRVSGRSEKVLPERKANAYQLVIEKLPMLAFSALSIGLTIYSTQQIGINVAEHAAPMTLRFANALVSYFGYLAKIFWPHNLAVFYPFPKALPMWQVAGSGVLLILFTTLSLLSAKDKPYLTIGWLWYLGTLVPVIGIFQAGAWPALADRWAYVPMIGIITIIAWATPEITSKWRIRVPVLSLFGISILVCCAVLVRLQVQYWQNSRILFQHALEVTQESSLAHNNLGLALFGEGQTNAALQHFKTALKLKPQNIEAHNNMGQALLKQGMVNEAVDHYRKLLKLYPSEAVTHKCLALALFEQGRIAESISHLQTSLRLRPNYASGYFNLGKIYFKQGQTKKAAKCYLEAIRLRPDFPEAHNNLGILLLKEGKLRMAVSYFRKALEQKNDYAPALENLEKVRLAQNAAKEKQAQIMDKLSRNSGDAALYLKLGDLYQEQGELTEALKNYQKAFSLRPNSLPAIKKLAIGHAMNGGYDKAIELLNKLILLKPDDTAPYIYLAGIYARQNKLNESIEWLKRAIAKGYRNWDSLKKDQNFDNIKEAPSFKALIPAEPLNAEL